MADWIFIRYSWDEREAPTREQHPAGVKWGAPLSVQRDRGREHGREWLVSAQLPGKSSEIIPGISRQEARTVPDRRSQSEDIRLEAGFQHGKKVERPGNLPQRDFRACLELRGAIGSA